MNDLGIAVKHYYKKTMKLSPARIIFLGFAALIILGAFLLTLPISAKSGESTAFTDALFTSASSVCVTGLVVVDTNTYWSLFGKTVILLLIQIGALGIMSVAALFSVITGKKLGLTQRLAIKETISNFTLESIVKVFKGIVIVTLIIEGFGAVLTSIVLIPIYGPVKGIAKSFFHSVSAFCNAGFDVFGTDADKFTSLTGFKGNYLMLLTTALLIILGGLGFIVWNDIAVNRRFSRFTLHTKIVIVSTVFLLLAGTIGYLAFESGNSMKELPLHVQILNSFFSSVSARTAGFNTLSLDKLNEASGLLTIILMFIGAAPGSTAGGIKLTTMFVLVLTVIAFLRGRNEIQVFKRRIAVDVISKAVSIFILSIALIMFTTIILLINKEGRLLQALFEATSAFGTVGLSTGITPHLNDISKYMLIITMFLGRIGTITAVAAFTSMQEKDNITYRYPEGKITVG